MQCVVDNDVMPRSVNPVPWEGAQRETAEDRAMMSSYVIARMMSTRQARTYQSLALA